MIGRLAFWGSIGALALLAISLFFAFGPVDEPSDEEEAIELLAPRKEPEIDRGVVDVNRNEKLDTDKVVAERKPLFSLLREGDEILDVKQPRLLRHYGASDQSGEDDLKAVSFVLQQFWMLFKDPDLLVVGSNEDVVRSLAGGNPEAVAFVSADNDFIDAEGRLLDRWGEPLFFHAESMTRIEIRSSGPDRDRFTDDDILERASTPLRLMNP